MTSPERSGTQLATQRRHFDEHERRERRRDRTRVVVSWAAVILLAILVWIVWRWWQERDAAAGNATSLADQVTEACLAGGQAAAELEARGACGQARHIAADPQQPAPMSLPADDEQVRRIVREYLEDNPPAGGADGPAGRPPTDAEVETAVQRVCARINCQGEPGADGINGADGADGADGINGENGQDGAQGEEGKQGPPPSDEQVRAVVDGYCSVNNGCRPTAQEVEAAVSTYCGQANQPCRGLLPDEYTRVDQDPLLGAVTWRCTRTTPPEAVPPNYSCTRENP